MTRIQVFALATVYLIVILAVGLIYFVRPEWFSFFLPESRFFGPIPVGVPWFGALGAVVISLTGVFQHEHDWEEGLWPWHVSRPLIGIALSVVSVLILQSGILAVGSNPQAHTETTKNLLYFIVAFMVGYREETFRELIKRLVDIILSPGPAGAAAPAIHQINPAQAPHDTSTQVVITGSGFTGTQSLKFGNSAAKFTVNSDGQLTAMTPVVPAAGAVSATVTTKAGSANAPFSFT